MTTLFCGIIRDKDYRLNKWQVLCLDVPAPQPGPGSPCVLAATAWVPICCPRGVGPWARMRPSAARGVSTGLLGGLSLLQPLTRLPPPSVPATSRSTPSTLASAAWRARAGPCSLKSPLRTSRSRKCFHCAPWSHASHPRSPADREAHGGKSQAGTVALHGQHVPFWALAVYFGHVYC